MVPYRSFDITKDRNIGLTQMSILKNGFKCMFNFSYSISTKSSIQEYLYLLTQLSINQLISKSKLLMFNYGIYIIFERGFPKQNI